MTGLEQMSAFWWLSINEMNPGLCVFLMMELYYYHVCNAYLLVHVHNYAYTYLYT